MFDHLSLGVSDLERSRAFYDAALKPLGYGRVMDFAEATGYGLSDHPGFWIGAAGAEAVASPGFHAAFAAPGQAVVDAFHAAATAAGGRDNGKPGLRPEYHPNYYAAFVTDPDGHRLEAVCHSPA